MSAALPAASASAAEAAQPPEKAEVKTPLDLLAGDAEAGTSFRVPQSDEWALFPAGTTECGTDVDGHVVRLDKAAAQDEFEAERLKNKKGEIAQKYAAKLVAFAGSGNASGRGFAVDDFTVALGKYDFATHRYPLTISAGEQSKWPLTAQTPTLAPDSVNLSEDREIAKLGGKKLTVEGQRTITSYGNKSTMTVQVSAPTAEADEMKSSAPTDVLLLMRFVGLGYHKACDTECSTILGVYGCVSGNKGFGTHYRADLVGYRVTVNGRVVAEKQPAAGLKRPLRRYEIPKHRHSTERQNTMMDDALFVSLSVSYPQISLRTQDSWALRNCTCGWWRLGEARARGVKYLFGVFRAQVVSAYVTAPFSDWSVAPASATGAGRRYVHVNDVSPESWGRALQWKGPKMAGAVRYAHVAVDEIGVVSYTTEDALDADEQVGDEDWTRGGGQ